MSECQFNHEGFCILEDEYPNVSKCSYAKGRLRKCTAKPSDLIELCPDCEKPTNECDCGTCWVILKDKEENFAVVTPKTYQNLKERVAGRRGKETPDA